MLQYLEELELTTAFQNPSYLRARTMNNNYRKPHVEAADNTRVRSAVRLIGSAKSRGAAYTRGFKVLNNNPVLYKRGGYRSHYIEYY